MIPFNKPFLTGRELEYIAQAHANVHLSGDGPCTRKCQAWIREGAQIRHCCGIPAALITRAQRAISARMNCANSSRLIGAASTTMSRRRC